VEELLEQALAEYLIVGGQAVHLLPQPVVRNDGAGVVHLRFAEHKRQDGDEEVKFGDSDYAQSIIGDCQTEALQDFCGVVLATQGIEGEGSIKPLLVHDNRPPEQTGDAGSQPLEQACRGGGRAAHPDQMERLHGYSGFFQPYFLILL
jgi:hypothetical protein